jgi:hypothetical protein
MCSPRLYAGSVISGQGFLSHLFFLFQVSMCAGGLIVDIGNNGLASMSRAKI